MTEVSKHRAFNCEEDPSDLLSVFRVGPIGHDMSLVAVRTLVGEPEFDDDEEATVSTILIGPERARSVAAALIHFADEVEGQIYPLVDWSLESD